MALSALISLYRSFLRINFCQPRFLDAKASVGFYATHKPCPAIRLTPTPVAPKNRRDPGQLEILRRGPVLRENLTRRLRHFGNSNG